MQGCFGACMALDSETCQHNTVQKCPFELDFKQHMK